MKRTADEAALSMVPQRFRVNVFVPPEPLTNNQEMHFQLYIYSRLSEADFSTSDVYNPWSMSAHFIISAPAGWTSSGFYSVDYDLEYTPAPTIRPYSSGSVTRSFSARINEKTITSVQYMYTSVSCTCICLLHGGRMFHSHFKNSCCSFVRRLSS